jgi:UDP-2,3-diacylglucosamine pyrophosphatase LpxH
MRIEDIVIISDVHLGSRPCRSKQLLHCLKNIQFKKLILNGDIFDDLNFKRLDHDDWAFLSYVRELSNPKHPEEVIWIAGNHDGAANILSRLIGVEVLKEYRFDWRGKKCLALHGHQYDRYMVRNPYISMIAAKVYLFIQSIDSERQLFSRFMKRASKAWLRNSERVAVGAASHGYRDHVDVVFCGHTHRDLAEKLGKVEYYNSGCWTDIPSSYITLGDEGIRVNYEN